MTYPGFSLIAVALAVCCLTGSPAASEDRFEEPAMAESGSPDADLAEAGDSDAQTEGAESPDGLVVGAGSPDAPSRMATSESPDAFVEGSESPDADLGHSEDLGSLGNAAREDAAIERSDMREVEVEQSHDGMRLQAEIGSIHGAKMAVNAAKERVARANAAYSEMLTSGYPRGEARQRIVDERTLAQQALESAENHYDQILRGGAASPD